MQYYTSHILVFKFLKFQDNLVSEIMDCLRYFYNGVTREKKEFSVSLQSAKIYFGDKS